MLVFPPKYKNYWYGINTKWTVFNEESWAVGQKLFAYCHIGMGLIFIIAGLFISVANVHGFSFVLLLIALWKMSTYFVNKKLSNLINDKIN